MGSNIYAKASGNCLNEKEKCDEYSGACHYQNPERMELVTRMVYKGVANKNEAFRWRKKHQILKTLQPIAVKPHM